MNKIFDIIGKYKVMFVIIASYVVILLLFLATFFAIYFISKNTYNSYFDDNAKIIADNISEKYDQYMEQSNTKTINSILLNEEIQNNVKKINNGSAAKECLINVRKQLDIIRIDNEYLADVLVYIKNCEIIICQTGFCTTQQYYLAYAKDSFSSYDEFADFLNNAGTDYKLYSPQANQTFFKTQYNLYRENVEIGKIILRNDIESILNSFVDENSDIVIIQDGYVVAASDMALANHILNTNEAENEIFELDGKRIYRNSMRDGRRKCFYIMDIKKTEDTNNTYSIFMIAACVICILLCSLMCIVFFFIHYIPIKKFGDFIKAKSKNKGDYTYKMFFEAVNHVEKSEKYIQMELQEKEKNLREVYFEQWLLYKKTPEKDIIKILPGQMCALIVLKAEGYEQIFFEQVYEENLLKLETANFILTNIFDEEFCNLFSDVIKCKLNDLLIWFVVFDEKADWQNGLRKSFEYVTPLIRNEFNISFECYKSKECSKMEKILEDFDAIMEEIKQKEEQLDLEALALLGVDESKKSIYYFPETIKKQLCASIEDGNVTTATIIIDNILNYNINTMHCGINNLKALGAEIYNTIIIRMECFDVDIKKQFEENRLGKDIIMSESIEEITKKLKKFVDTMCGFFFSKQNQNDSVYIKARRFIYQNYKNPQLSSATIADELGLSRDYFLSVFKKESGMKAADYIHQIRVEEACGILKKTNHSIAETAYLVGYSNAKTFSRVFSKIMGITPGVYRESRN